MDKEKAKLIFEKFNEILEIVDSEENDSRYFDISRVTDTISFFNGPESKNAYGFTMINGKVIRYK